MRLYMVKTPHGLSPWGECDYEELRGLREGETYPVEVKTSRNVGFHKKYMSFFNHVWECLNEGQREFFHESVTGFRKTVEVAAGHYDVVYSMSKGEWLQIPRSVSFTETEQHELEELFSRVKDVVFREFLDGMSEEEFNRRLSGFYND